LGQTTIKDHEIECFRCVRICVNASHHFRIQPHPCWDCEQAP